MLPLFFGYIFPVPNFLRLPVILKKKEKKKTQGSRAEVLFLLTGSLSVAPYTVNKGCYGIFGLIYLVVCYWYILTQKLGVKIQIAVLMNCQTI